MADAFLNSSGRLDISKGVIDRTGRFYPEEIAFLAGISDLELSQDSGILNGAMLAGVKWSTVFNCHVQHERPDVTVQGGKFVIKMHWEKAPFFVRHIFTAWVFELLGFYEWEDHATVHYYG